MLSRSLCTGTTTESSGIASIRMAVETNYRLRQRPLSPAGSAGDRIAPDCGDALELSGVLCQQNQSTPAYRKNAPAQAVSFEIFGRGNALVGDINDGNGTTRRRHHQVDG